MGTGGSKAFTLVELLAVTVMIAVLASVLLPAMATGRELARRAVCANNLHGIGIAFAGYLCKFKVYPTYGSSETSRSSNYFITRGGPGDAWEDWTALYKEGYFTSPGILFCPSTSNKSFRYNTPQNPWLSGQTRTGYSRRYFAGPSLTPFAQVNYSQVLAADLIYAPAKLKIEHETGCNVLYQGGTVLFREDVPALFTDAGVAGNATAGNAQLDQVWEGLDLK